MELTATRAWGPERLRLRFPAAMAAAAAGEHYLDGAATSQRMSPALRAQGDYEAGPVGNAHRGAHPWAARSSAALEGARAEVGRHLGVEAEAVAFTSGATESANLLAQAIGPSLAEEDVVFVSQMEHHSNYLPWLAMSKRAGCSFVEMPVGQDGSIDVDWFERSVERMRPKWMCVTAMSNVTGKTPPVAWMSGLAKKANPLARVVVDAAQAIAHVPADPPLWGGDYAFFSSHKVFAPSGSGVLAARNPALLDLDPGKYGGGMIRGFRADGSPRWAGGRAGHEAGSANVGAALGLAAALRELGEWDLSLMRAHEEALGRWTAGELARIGGVEILGGASEHGIVSFHASWAHAHDIGAALDARRVYARVGHHCALPLMRAFGVNACTRLSFGPTSDESDAMAAVEAVADARRRFS